MSKRHFFNAALLVILSLGLAACAGSQTQESTGEFIDDAAISAKVKSKLLASDDVSGTAINVETFKGTVQLSGFVNSDDERREAESITATVKGVRNVENRLAVKGS